MPAALVADWGAVRATAIATGSLLEASRAHGLPHGAVRERARREQWPVCIRARRMAAQANANAAQQVARTRMTPVTVTESAPGDALAAHLAATGERTRGHLARALEAAASHAGTLPGRESLKAARSVHEVAKAAGLVHGWQGQEREGSMTILSTVNVLSLQQAAPEPKAVPGKTIEG